MNDERRRVVIVAHIYIAAWLCSIPYDTREVLGWIAAYFVVRALVLWFYEWRNK